MMGGGGGGGYCPKNRWGRQVFFLLPQKQKRHVFYDDIWTDTRAMLDNKSSDFLEKQPFTRHYKVRKMRRLYTCTKPHKKSIPSPYTIFRRSGKCMRNKYRTKRNNEIFLMQIFFVKKSVMRGLWGQCGGAWESNILIFGLTTVFRNHSLGIFNS